MAQSKCETCAKYEYDEEYETYTCAVDLDEDEMARFMQDKFDDCPYYDPDGEYKIVRKQI